MGKNLFRKALAALCAAGLLLAAAGCADETERIVYRDREPSEAEGTTDYFNINENDGTLTLKNESKCPENVTIPAGTKKIGIGAFNGCTTLKSVVILNGVQEIGDSAFAGCSNLETVLIQGSVWSIGSGAFSGTTSLADIYYDGTLAQWGAISAKAGVSGEVEIHYNAGEIELDIFTVNGTNLVRADKDRCPANIAIPDGVTKIAGGLLSECAELATVVFPDSVETIGDGAFSNCASLALIVLRSGVKEIGTDAFAGTGLRHIYYGGNEEMWNTISAGAGIPETAEIHYGSDSVIPDDGEDAYKVGNIVIRDGTRYLVIRNTAETPQLVVGEHAALGYYPNAAADKQRDKLLEKYNVSGPYIMLFNAAKTKELSSTATTWDDEYLIIHNMKKTWRVRYRWEESKIGNFDRKSETDLRKDYDPTSFIIDNNTAVYEDDLSKKLSDYYYFAYDASGKHCNYDDSNLTEKRTMYDYVMINGEAKHQYEFYDRISNNQYQYWLRNPVANSSFFGFYINYGADGLPTTYKLDARGTGTPDGSTDSTIYFISITVSSNMNADPREYVSRSPITKDIGGTAYPVEITVSAPFENTNAPLANYTKVTFALEEHNGSAVYFPKKDDYGQYEFISNFEKDFVDLFTGKSIGTPGLPNTEIPKITGELKETSLYHLGNTSLSSNFDDKGIITDFGQGTVSDSNPNKNLGAYLYYPVPIDLDDSAELTVTVRVSAANEKMGAGFVVMDDDKKINSYVFATTASAIRFYGGTGSNVNADGSLKENSNGWESGSIERDEKGQPKYLTTKVSYTFKIRLSGKNMTFTVYDSNGDIAALRKARYYSLYVGDTGKFYFAIGAIKGYTSYISYSDIKVQINDKACVIDSVKRADGSEFPNYLIEKNREITGYRDNIPPDIVIPDGVTAIGKEAFRNCGQLKSVVIPEGVTRINSRAFENCYNLRSVTIPLSMDYIAWDAFYGYYQSGLVLRYEGTSEQWQKFNVNLDSNISVYCSDTPEGLPEWVTVRGTTITSYNRDAGERPTLKIPEGITAIEESAFSNCDYLTSVEIPGSVTSIGQSAFSECRSLKDVTIGDGVMSIGRNAFYNCNALTTITIPDSVTNIGQSTFSYCQNLTDVTIGDGVMSIGNNAFYNCNALTTITIPGNVTNIGQSAFSECRSLTDVTIGNGVTSIGSQAFIYCTSLSSVTFADKTTEWFAATEWSYGKENDEIVIYDGESIGKWSSDALENAKKLAGYYTDDDNNYYTQGEYVHKFLYSEKYKAQ